MNKHYSYFLFFLACIGCQNITSSNTINSHKVFEYGFTYSAEVSSSEKNIISGYSSISHFSDVYDQKISLYDGNFTNLVFAVNDQKNPVFVSFLTENNTYVFGYKETALTLISALCLPFLSPANSQVMRKLEGYSEFKKLVNRLKLLSTKNESFIHDKIVLSLLNEISNQLAKDFTSKKNNIELIFEHEISNSNLLTLTGNSKLPFNINFQNSVTKTSSNSLYTGYPLKSEYRDTLKSNTSFLTEDGGYELFVKSDALASKNRYQKISRDLILKLYSILGLERKNYKSNNPTEISILSKSLPENPSKVEAVNFTRKHFDEQSELISQHLIKKVKGSDFNRENFRNFVYIVETLILSQEADSPFYSNDIFYDELDTFRTHFESRTICFQNSNEVPCLPDVSEITYNIGQAGCNEGEFRITFGSGFYAPFGLDQGSKIKINWKFDPLGKSGFWLIPVKNKKTTITGRTKTVGCFNFDSKKELTLSITLNDHGQRLSNTSHITIEKPKTKSVISNSEPSATFFDTHFQIQD